MDSLLFEGEILMEKMQMKGGWTYVLLPDVVKERKKSFGWTKLNATVDGYEMNNASLMPIKGGRLFLAIKAEIRKQIKKEAGDTVLVKLYGNKAPDTVAESDFFEALADDPGALQHFGSFPQKEQKLYLSWIFAGINSEDIVGRIADAINEIANGRYCKFSGKEIKKVATKTDN